MDRDIKTDEQSAGRFGIRIEKMIMNLFRSEKSKTLRENALWIQAVREFSLRYTDLTAKMTVEENVGQKKSWLEHFSNVLKPSNILNHLFTSLNRQDRDHIE